MSSSVAQDAPLETHRSIAWSSPATGLVASLIGWEKRKIAIQIHLLAASEFRAAYPLSSTSQKFSPRIRKSKAATLASGSDSKHRCCPALELVGGCSTPVTQMSMFSRAEIGKKKNRFLSVELGSQDS